LNTRFSLGVCCAAMSFMLALPARANTSFVNGNFQTVGAVTGAGASGSFSLEDPTGNENALTGWSLYTGAGLTTNQVLNCVVMGGTNTNVCGTLEFGGGFSYWVNPGLSPDGGNYYAADGDDSYTDNGTSPTGGVAGGYAVPLYQTITGISPGSSYILSFDQAAAQQSVKSGATTEQWEVEFCTTLPTVDCTGSNAQFSSLMSDASHGDIPWQSQVMTFTATAATEVLEFIAIGTPNGEPPFVLLDGVGFQQATPEPGTLALIGLGLVAIPLAARRRQMRRKPRILSRGSTAA
jgi:hypothetical protein